MDVLAITSAGYGGRLCFLDESNLCYASGHGVVIHDKDSGLQKHIWTLPEGQGHPPPNMAPATFATCPGGSLLAYVQQGGLQQQIQVVQQETLLPASTIKDPGARHIEFCQLVFDAEGTRLASVGGAPDHQLDVWDVDLKESLVRVLLPESLTGLEPAFFPLNSAVLALAGPHAARLIWEEPLAGARVVRQSEVELSVLVEGEQLSCTCWTPNGTLLLGTTAGRLLGVRCAAPPAVPAHGWGPHARGGHVAELLYGDTAPAPPPLPPPPPSVPAGLGGAPVAVLGGSLAAPKTGVAAVVATSTHLLLVMAGDARTAAELLWLSPHTLRPIAAAALPLRMLVRAVTSPSYEQLAIATADGAISLCRTVCPVSIPPLPAEQQEGGGGADAVEAGQHHSSVTGGGVGGAAAAAAAVGPEGAAAEPVRLAGVKVTEVVRYHRGRVTSCLWLSPRRFVTGGLDGSVRMWSYTASDAEPPDEATWEPPAVHLEATWHVGQPVTCMAALHPPLPPGAEWPAAGGSAAASRSGTGAGDGASSLYGGGDASIGGVPAWAAAASRPPAFMLGTAAGVVQVFNTDRLPATLAEGADGAMLAKSLTATWDVRVLDGPVTAAAFSQDGRFCAVACAPDGKIAFLRLMVLGHELSMRVLGIYPMREPRHLAWAPPEPGSIQPLLVVGTILGELLVLSIPESSAMEDGPADGCLTRGSLIRASMRAQSNVTSLAVYPLPAQDGRAGGGHFWVVTTHTDKSIRRYRMCTDQQKSAAAAASRAAAAGGGGGGGTESGGAAGAAAAAAAAAAAGRTTPPPGLASGASFNRSRPSTGQNLGRTMSIAPGNQNIQMPEAEKAMELAAAANAVSISLLAGAGSAVSGGGAGAAAASGGVAGGGHYGLPLRMAVASSDGSVAVFSMPEMALQGRWLLHEMTSGGVTALSLLGDKLLSVGGEGTVQVLELSSMTRGRHAGPRASHVGGTQTGAPPPPPAAASPLGRSPAPGGGGGGVAAGGGGLAQRSAFFSASGPPRPRGMERATLGSVLPLALHPLLPGVYTDADVAPSWQQARATATQELYREQLTTFRRKAQAKCQEWVKKIEELKEINAAAAEVERLTPEEFVIDQGLRKQMLAQAEVRYAAARAQQTRQMQIMQFQRQRLKEQCMGVMDCLARPLMALPEYSFISPMDPVEARKYRFEGEAAAARTAAAGGVWSYGLRKLSAQQELRFRQVAFLRKVEQAECATRSSMERGAVVPIRRYKGDMQRKFNLTTEEEQNPQGAAAAAAAGGQNPPGGAPGSGGGNGNGYGYGAPSAGQLQLVSHGSLAASSMRLSTAAGYDEDEFEDETASQAGGTSRRGTRRFRDDGFEGTEMGYGETGLLYADVQLYTHCRRAAQLVIIQEEVRCLQRAFNARWEESRRAKSKALDRIDERLGRIVEIHRELTKLAVEEGTGEPPAPAPHHVPGCFYVWQPEEEMAALAEVKDEEVKVPKYVSPEELARRAALAAAEEEARRRAAADDSRNRALKEMMNANPAISRVKKGGKNRAVREAWMDLPPGQLNKEQRQKLAEWERKQAELAEELEKHRRLLEAERRALEVEIVEMAAAVNTDLTRLAHAKVRMDMEVVHLERRCVDLAGAVAALAAAEAARSALSSQLAAFTTRRSRRVPLLAALEQRVAAAQKTYDDIAFSEKQVDRAFRREFSSRPELWDDAQKVYRARAHLLQACTSTGSIGDGSAGGGGGSARLPRKTALELLAKSPEGQALAAVLEAPGMAEPSTSHSVSSVGSPSRQPGYSRLASRLSGFDALGASNSPGGGSGGGGPDVLLTTPRGVPRAMVHLARPQPRPGSALQDFARRYLDKATVATSSHGELSASGGGGGGPLVSAALPRHGIAAVLRMAGDEASLARRGISQRQAGQLLRALAEKAGRPMEPLLQLVADGLPAPALVSHLGLLGLHLQGNQLGNLNPFKLDAAARAFSPELTGAAEALGESFGGGGSVGGGSTVGGASVGGPARERSSVSGGRLTTTNGSILPSKAEDPVPEDEDGEDPLDSRERPEGMDDAMWIRLLEFRQTRADLEMEAEEAWRRVSLLTAQLDWMEAEDADMEAQVEEAGARAAALRDGAVRLSLDVYLAYRLKNGQVELPYRPDDVVGAGDVLSDAIILHRNRVEALNEEVLFRGEGKIEVLETLRLTRRKIHLAQWETEAAEIAGQHAAQRLTELQLLHVTKDLQAALRDPTIVDRMNEEARLAVVWQSAANLHTHRIAQRKRTFEGLAHRVSRSGAEQSELSLAEAAAETAYGESERMHAMMSAAKAAEEASHRRHMRNIVTNSQLRQISEQQAVELEKLAEQLRQAQARTFPALTPMLAWMPPDYRPPSSAAGGMRPGSPGGASIMTAASAGSRVPSRASTALGGGRFATASSAYSSRPATALPAAGGGQRRPPSVQRSSITSGGGGGSRAGTPVSRSGGAGATLTRAYAVSRTSSASGGGPRGGAGLPPAPASAMAGGGGAAAAAAGGGSARGSAGSGVGGGVAGSRGAPRPPSGARPMSRRQ